MMPLLFANIFEGKVATSSKLLKCSSAIATIVSESMVNSLLTEIEPQISFSLTTIPL